MEMTPEIIRNLTEIARRRREECIALEEQNPALKQEREARAAARRTPEALARREAAHARLREEPVVVLSERAQKYGEMLEKLSIPSLQRLIAERNLPTKSDNKEALIEALVIDLNDNDP